MESVRWLDFMHDTAARGTNPTQLVVAPKLMSLTRLIHRSFDEGWDRRRFKRESRRAATSTYHKRPKT